MKRHWHSNNSDARYRYLESPGVPIEGGSQGVLNSLSPAPTLWMDRNLYLPIKAEDRRIILHLAIQYLRPTNILRAIETKPRAF